MLKRNVVFLFILFLLISALGLFKFWQIKQGMAMMAANAPPPTSVEVTTALKVQWQPLVAAVGTLTAREGIEVSNELEGVVEIIHVQSGQTVNKGDLLVTINDDVEQADLTSFRALRELAYSQFKRNEKMWQEKTISAADFDNASSALKVAEANVRQTQARIDKKVIRAAFSGILGIRQVSIGQYVAPGTRLISLQDYSRLYIDFAVPEKYLPFITPGLDVNFSVNAYAEQSFTAQVQAIDAKVNEQTRNISVRAQLPNDQALLRPGMYADVSLMLNQPAERIVVPATAILFSSFGDALFTVVKNATGTLIARRVPVVTGEQRGDLVAIISGLEGGEQVVQAGAGKLRNEAPVAINQQPRLKPLNTQVIK